MNGLWVTIAGWVVTIGVSVAGWVITGRRAAVLGRADNVIISWLDSPQATERMGLPMAMPERR